MKEGLKAGLFVTFLLIAVILGILFSRAVSPREIDDISPQIPCEEQLITKSDILWVIPNYQGKPISENKTWCEYILNLNKTLGLHGYSHEFKEFKTDRNQEYVQGAIDEFEKCFGFKPTKFKPPQVEISLANKKLLEKNNLEVKLFENQIIHKVYHCSDTGRVKNYITDRI